MELKEIEKLAVELMTLHGLFEKGWALKFDNAKKRAGQCAKRNGLKWISLSTVVLPLHTDESIRDIILHEIAHAIVGLEHGHDKVWQKKALEIGCNGKRCYDNSAFKENGKKALISQSKYTLTCPNCGKELPAHRKRKRDVACGDCCRRYNNGVYTDKYKLIVTQNY